MGRGPMLCKVPAIPVSRGDLGDHERDLAAQVSQSDTSTAFRVKKGDKLLINASDDLAWLYVSILDTNRIPTTKALRKAGFPSTVWTSWAPTVGWTPTT